MQAGSDYILLGSAEQGVVPIHRYTEEEAREAGLIDVIDAGHSPRRAVAAADPGRRAPRTTTRCSMPVARPGDDGHRPAS